MERRYWKLMLAALAATVLVSRPTAARTAARGETGFTRRAIVRGLSRNLTPQQAATAARLARFHLAIDTDKAAYRVGDLLKITVHADRDCYLIVYYVDSQGNSAIVCPSPFCTANHVTASQPYQLTDDHGRMLQEKGPPGAEEIQVLATADRIDVTRLAGIQLPPPVAHAPTGGSDGGGAPTGLARGTRQGFFANLFSGLLSGLIKVINPQAMVQSAVDIVGNAILQKTSQWLTQISPPTITDSGAPGSADAARGLGPQDAKAIAVYGLAAVRYDVLPPAASPSGSPSP